MTCASWCQISVIVGAFILVIARGASHFRLVHKMPRQPNNEPRMGWCTRSRVVAASGATTGVDGVGAGAGAGAPVMAALAQ
jgi:hypothetical protein